MHSELQRWRDIGSAVDEILDLEEEGQRRTEQSSDQQTPVLYALEAETPLDRPLAAGFEGLLDRALASRSPAGLRPGDEVGPFRIESVIGEGGMGTVFLARRADGSFEQDVALKLLHRRPTDEHAYSRFLQERQILAGLRHPHIARLLDGGMIHGTPYLVMEHVDGEPVTDYCERRSLGQEARLRLVLQVCDAISHAHRQGVIHRDLKPSNLLVEAEPSGGARMVVLDFGIALVEHAEAQVTATGQIFGTPGYMSPEQARGRRAEIDRRSDVYALGVLLYELLSGQRPFPGEDAHQVLHDVMFGEPTPLRRRLPQVSADLATIVETCLARHPAHRYDSVRALTGDLESYLDGRPIAARPLGWLSRWWRRARRRPRTAALVASAAAVTATSLVLLAITATSYTRNLEVERNAALAARSEAEDLLDFMLTDLHAGLNQVGRLDLLEQVARRSLEYYERWSAGDLADHIEGRATALYNAGQVLENQGDSEGAKDAYERHLRLFDQLSESDLGPRQQLQLARGHEALAGNFADFGEVTEALKHVTAALAISQRLGAGEEPPSGWAELHFDALAAHGWIVLETGSSDQATAILDEARTFAATKAGGSDSAAWRHREAVALSYLGLVHLEAAEPEAALDRFLAARPHCEALVAEAPANNLWREELQLVLARIGAAQLDLGRLEAAISTLQQARLQSEILIQREPGNAGWMRELAIVHSSLYTAHYGAGVLDEAMVHLQESLKITRSQARRFPNNDSVKNDLAWDLVALGRIRQAREEPVEATRAWVEAADVMRDVRQRHPDFSYYLDTEVQALLELGRVDEARPLVHRLHQAGWTDPDFLALCERYGLEPEAVLPGAVPGVS